MPRYYFLYPSHEGPFPNPFSIDDPVFRMSLHAVRFLREPEDEVEPQSASELDEAPDRASEPATDDSAAYKSWKNKLYFVSLEACSIAFVELVNRTLLSIPPSEAHWDFAATEAAHRALALAFYIYYEAVTDRLPYGRKRGMEVLLTDWLAEAKDIWRARVLDLECHDLMKVPREKAWNVPKLPTYLREEVWTVDPDADEVPPNVQEQLFRPITFAEIEPENLQVWIEAAFHLLSKDAADAEFRLDKSRVNNSLTAEQGPKFAARTAWLNQRLLERGWSTSDPYTHGGPNRKTVEKMLRGGRVRNDVLKKLAEALSRKCGAVSVLDFPET